MNTLKKILAFGGVCCYALGLIGGAGSAFYVGSYPCGVGCIVLGVMAWPTLKSCIKELTK